MQFFSGLHKFSGSKVLKSEKIIPTKLRGKTINWNWLVECGLCKTSVTLRIDGGVKGRVSHFYRS